MKILKRLFEKKKNIYNIIIAVIAGIALMIIGGGVPEKENNDNTQQERDYMTEYENKVEEKVKCMLENAEGVGRTKVSIILKSGREKVVQRDLSLQTDEKEYRQTKEEKAVFNSLDEPFVVVEKEPEIEGVVVVCDGGDDIYVKQKIISAVSALLGVEVHKIEVIKMKTGG